MIQQFSHDTTPRFRDLSIGDLCTLAKSYVGWTLFYGFIGALVLTGTKASSGSGLTNMVVGYWPSRLFWSALTILIVWNAGPIFERVGSFILAMAEVGWMVPKKTRIAVLVPAILGIFFGTLYPTASLIALFGLILPLWRVIERYWLLQDDRNPAWSARVSQRIAQTRSDVLKRLEKRWAVSVF